MISKEARLDLLSKLFRGASKAKNIGAQTARSVAGLGPGQKFFSRPSQALKNTGRSLVAPQIPGLDRPIAAGVVRAAQLSRPSTWSRLASSSRAPASGKKTGYMGEGWRKPWQGRAHDKKRQLLAHAIRGTGKGSVLATGAGLGVGAYYGLPQQIANTLKNSLGIYNNPETNYERDAELRAKIRGAAPGLLSAIGDKSPMSQMHNEILRESAIPWAREQAYYGSRYDPYGRAAKKLRWLNPAGALMNTVLLPAIEKETEPGQLQGIADRALERHYKGITDPAQREANLASPYTKFYRDVIPQDWLDRKDVSEGAAVKDWRNNRSVAARGLAPSLFIEKYKRGVTPLGQNAAIESWQNEHSPYAVSTRPKARQSLRDIGERAGLNWQQRQLAATRLVPFGPESPYARTRYDAQIKHINPAAASVGDTASLGLQQFLREGGSYLDKNPRTLPATEAAMYLYLKNKGYNPSSPAQAAKLVILTIDNQLKAVRKEQTQPNLSPQRALALKQQETQLTQFRQQMASRRTEHTGSIPG